MGGVDGGESGYQAGHTGQRIRPTSVKALRCTLLSSVATSVSKGHLVAFQPTKEAPWANHAGERGGHYIGNLTQFGGV